MLREDDFAVVVEDSEGRDAVEVYTAALGDIEVGIDAADVDVDLDEVLGEELGVGTLMEVDIEDLAVAAPVAAEVYEDALVRAVGLGDAGFQVFIGVGDRGIEIFLDRRRHGHGDARSVGDGRRSGRNGGRGRRRFLAAGDEEAGGQEGGCDGVTCCADRIFQSHVRLLKMHRSSSAKVQAGWYGDATFRRTVNPLCDAEGGVFDSDLL